MKSRRAARPGKRLAGRAALGAALVGVACSVYDPTLVEPLDRKPTPPVPTPDGGVGGDVLDPTGPICGDGRVSAGEKCDPGIAAGLPGACPVQCLSEVACVDRRLDGGGCQVECIDVPRACEAGDGCCPAGCTFDTDGDCSQSCGDGVVQREEGETCEPDSTEDPCPADCDDDDACTEDKRTGSEDNCNVECAHSAVTKIDDGDGCCPAGSNANQDADCKPECGNGVLEAGEDCDGGEGCESDCTQAAPTTAQEQCLAMFDDPDECEQCSCMACTDLMFACYDSGDATANAQCEAVVDCARANQCTGDPCYCGNLTLLTCWITNPAPGPCVPEINAAANATDSGMVGINRVNVDLPIYDADQLGACSVTNCPSVCP